MKPDALYIGISSERFWEMTYSEVLDEIEVFRKRSEAEEKRRMQNNAVLLHGVAFLVGLAVCDSKRYPKTPEKAFPDIFRKESAQFNWKASKAGWAAYAKLHNAKRGGK